METAYKLKTRAYQMRAKGHATGARDLYMEAVESFHAHGEPLRAAHALRHVADIQRELGDLPSARKSIESVLKVYADQETGALERANTLRIAALIADGEQRTEEARAFWDAAGKLYVEAGVADSI